MDSKNRKPLSDNGRRLFELLKKHHGFDGDSCSNYAPLPLAEAAKALGITEEECDEVFAELFSDREDK